MRKARLLKLLVFVLLTAPLSVLGQGNDVKAAVTNLALNKAVYASSFEGLGFEANKAADGRTETRWSSKPTNNQWWKVDLGSLMEFNKIVIKWDADYGKDYKIMISSDNNTWTTIFSRTGFAGGTDTITIGSIQTARYVQFAGLTRGTANGYSFQEFEVYKSDETLPGPGSLPNLALNKTAFSSSVEAAGLEASKAVDGNTVTRWSSGASNNQWWKVDLGSPTNFDQIVIRWEAAFGKDYKIMISNDNATWTTIFTRQNFSGGTDTIVFSSMQNARYIQFAGISRGTTYGYSFWEFEVNNREDAPSTGPGGNGNLALNKPAFASSFESPGITAEMAVDGNAATSWSSAYSNNQWWKVDLGTAKTFNTVVIKWLSAYGKDYDIKISDNNTNWTTVYQKRGGIGGNDVLVMNPQSARYIMVQGIARGSKFGYAFSEFEVYEGPGTLPTYADRADLAKNRIAYASSGNAGAAVDSDNAETLWESGTSGNEWIYVDLGAVKKFDRLILRWDASYAKVYEVQTSNDTQNWTTIYSTTSGNGSIDDLAVSGNARYVKLNCIAAGVDWGYYGLWGIGIYHEAEPAPIIPTTGNLEAAALNSYSVKLSWNAPEGAYKVRIKRDGQMLDEFASIAGSSYTDYLLWQSSAYNYVVEFLDTSNQYVASWTAGVTTPSQQGMFPRLFSDDAFVNRPIGPNPQVDPNSAAMINYAIVPEKGRSHVTHDGYGITLAYANPVSEVYTIPYYYYGGSETIKARIPKYAVTTSGWDHHVTIINPSINRNVDTWLAVYDYSNNTWKAGSRGIIDLNGEPNVVESGISGVAAGWASMTGVIRPEEIAQGRIEHAITFTSPRTRKGWYSSPAIKADGRDANAFSIPEGALLQLDPSIDIDSVYPNWPEWKKIIAKAAQEYGMYCSDTSGAMTIRGESNDSRHYDAWAKAGVTEDTTLNDFPWESLRVLQMDLHPWGN
ncbi:discoidin domain-containing protein [Paenibacillus sp. GCM10027626]|uniref:discoidin domain-containing protein n=1 Tax=Paenibacillus sp. GCM10027626 TaxID=3273411 RepID=UPI00362C9FA0